MDYLEQIEPVTMLKTKSAKILRKVRTSGQPVVITQNGKPRAILIDIETYQRQRKAFLLLKYLAQGDKDHREGRSMTQAKAEKHFAGTLRKLHARR